MPFSVLTLLTGLADYLVIPPPQKKKKKKKKHQSWILCQNSLTREHKIRVVGFVLKKLFSHFEMLVVSHASHCVNSHYFIFCLFWQSDILFVSVKQILSLRSLVK